MIDRVHRGDARARQAALSVSASSTTTEALEIIVTTSSHETTTRAPENQWTTDVWTSTDSSVANFGVHHRFPR